MLVAARHEGLLGRWMIKVVPKHLAPFIPDELRAAKGAVILVDLQTLRWVRLLAGLAQIPLVQQSPFALSFTRNAWRLLISDGLLTEFFVDRLGVRPRTFYSMQQTRSSATPLLDATAIVGSNWLEFGCMSEASYVAHLTFLRDRYPGATYYCHPMEANTLPEAVFGVARVARPSMPVEILLRRTGEAGRVVGVCSSVLLNLALSWPASIRIDLIDIAPEWLDGPTGDRLQVLDPPLKGLDHIRIIDLQDYLLDLLSDKGVKVEAVKHAYP